jgi:hypothetical protein
LKASRKTKTNKLQTEAMNHTTDHSFKRSKARKNKENLAQNRIQQENPTNPTRRPKKNTSKLLLRKKPRLKIKEQNLSTSGLFFKRYSFQNAGDVTTKSFKTDRSHEFKNLKKRVGNKENSKETRPKQRSKGNVNKKETHRALKSFDWRKIEENKTTRHKGKTFSSSNFGLSRILKNVERKNNKIEQNVSISERLKLQESKKSCSGGLKKKKPFAKHKEIKLKSKERYDCMKLSKPPLLTKPGNYTSHNPGVQRVKVNGMLKRKLSINLPSNLRGKNALSKPNSPCFNMKGDLGVDQRCFKTMNKDLCDFDKEVDFLPGGKLIKTERLASSLRNQLEKENKNKSDKTENLKQILKRKKFKNQGRELEKDKSTENVSNCSSFNYMKRNMSHSIANAQLKTPVGDNGKSPTSPLNPFMQKQQKKIKNIFSFNKSSKQNVMEEKLEKNKQIFNNTSLLYSQALNQNKNQNSFIFFKNKIGSNVSGFTCPDTSNLNLKNESFSLGLISNINPKTKNHQSFLLNNEKTKPNKKRSKSFFEMKALDLMSTSINFPKQAKSDQNISLLGLNRLNRSYNRARNQNQSESEKLTQLIESIKEKEEDALSVQIIQEELEVSSRIHEVSKRPASLEGIFI